MISKSSQNSYPLHGHNSTNITRKKSNLKDALSDVESGDEELVDKRGKEIVENSSDYWLIQKLVKYLRIGNQTATVIAISALRDFDLTLEQHQVALRDLGALELFVNLLETKESRCVRAALLVLLDTSTNISIRASLAEMDVILPLVRLLDDPSVDIRCKAAETIANCARNIKARRMVRYYNGITKLVRLLKSTHDETIQCAASALWTCSKSERNKRDMESIGIMDALSRLVTTKNTKVLTPVVGLLQECAKNENYRLDIRRLGILSSVIAHIQNTAQVDVQLSTHVLNCVFQCANDAESRKIVRDANGLVPIANLLDKYQQQISKDSSPNDAREYLAAVTGAIWKLCLDTANIPAFLQVGVVKKLVVLLEQLQQQQSSETVLVHIVGALGSFAQIQQGRTAVKEAQGIRQVIQLLTRSDGHILENAANTIGACALDNDCMAIIDKNDGVRLLWSLLKSPYPHVQASAAWAIRPCIEHAKDAGEMVRSFVGGLELMVHLLKSDNDLVLSGVCAVLAKIAKDDENLGVMTDHGIVSMLSRLTSSKNDHLRKPLAEAISQCCCWGKNRIGFGNAGAVGPLVKFLRSSDQEVQKQTVFALQQLSIESGNCVTLHENGAVALLLDMVGSADEQLQEAAAATIGNIRRVALK